MASSILYCGVAVLCGAAVAGFAWGLVGLGPAVHVFLAVAMLGIRFSATA